MKILVRLPNWLGDMVMASAFIDQLSRYFPGSEISVIAKKGIHELLDFFPTVNERYVFNKEEYKGLTGLWKFGKRLRGQRFDLFFSLPNSFSAALMGYATGATCRVGYRKELRQIFLTHSFPLSKDLHRVEEYAHLLKLFTNKEAGSVRVRLEHATPRGAHIVVNFNSEASSRRLTKDKAVELVGSLRQAIDHQIFLIGGPTERQFVQSIFEALPEKKAVVNIAGSTNLTELVHYLASARLMLTTDSGPAHLANALGTETIVLFGAGNEAHTAPYNSDFCTVIRLGELSCEPCEKNICVRYGIPQCLERLNTALIVQTVKMKLDAGNFF
jgi:heptosyltransferase II